jgi:hypothetical protein
MKRGRVLIVAAMVAAAAPLISVLDGPAAHAAGNTRKVSTTGTDTGNCKFAPCATINYALSQSLPYDTITVAAGTYNQTVNIEKPINLIGAGAATTTLDGTNLDPSTGPNNPYGVVYVGTTGGSVNITGFTVTNPFTYAFTSGEPMIIALKDTKSTDAVTITKDILTEGSSDANAQSDFPIGIDTFLNSAQTTITNNTVSGTFQGALFEDNGPLNFSANTLTALISGTDNTTTPPTVYPAEGAFFLSDESGSLTNQQARANTLQNYGGYGLIMEAGYNNGNCTSTPCNGSIAGSMVSNNITLTPGVAGTYGMVFKSEFAGNVLGAVSKSNKGTVKSPTIPELVLAKSGGAISVSEYGNNVTTNGVNQAGPGSVSNMAPIHLARLH